VAASLQAPRPRSLAPSLSLPFLFPCRCPRHLICSFLLASPLPQSNNPISNGHLFSPTVSLRPGIVTSSSPQVQFSHTEPSIRTGTTQDSAELVCTTPALALCAFPLHSTRAARFVPLRPCLPDSQSTGSALSLPSRSGSSAADCEQVPGIHLFKTPPCGPISTESAKRLLGMLTCLMSFRPCHRYSKWEYVPLFLAQTPSNLIIAVHAFEATAPLNAITKTGYSLRFANPAGL
jgi:hypothetical protein